MSTTPTVGERASTATTDSYILLDEPLFDSVTRHALSDGRRLARTDDVADIYVEMAGGSIVAIEAMNGGEQLPVTLIRESPRIAPPEPRGSRFIRRRGRSSTPSRYGVCVDATRAGKGLHFYTVSRADLGF